MSIEAKYKILKLSSSGFSSEKKADEALAHLNNEFNADDFHVVLNDDNVEVWLRQVDLNELQDAVARTTRNYLAHGGALSGIFQAVEGVKSYGINGNKRLYVGYNKERKVSGRKEKEKQRGKYFYAQGNDFAREHNAVPSEMIDRIICGDSEEELKQLPDNCIDLVFTSPPYNFGLDYSGGDDASFWESYFQKLFRVFDQCIRVLRYGGRIIVNVQPLFSDYIPSHHIISNYFMKKRLIWKGEILWEKNHYNCKYTAWGSYASPSSPYLKYTWEFLEIFCKGDLKLSGDSGNADIDPEEFKKWVIARWSIAPERRMKEFDHPAMFPEELARRALLLFSFRGDTVLDPFAGAGTTCVTALRNHRRFIGIDVSEEYCRTASARLGDAQYRLQF